MHSSYDQWYNFVDLWSSMVIFQNPFGFCIGQMELNGDRLDITTTEFFRFLRLMATINLWMRMQYCFFFFINDPGQIIGKEFQKFLLVLPNT